MFQTVTLCELMRVGRRIKASINVVSFRSYRSVKAAVQFRWSRILPENYWSISTLFLPFQNIAPPTEKEWCFFSSWQKQCICFFFILHLKIYYILNQFEKDFHYISFGRRAFATVLRIIMKVHRNMNQYLNHYLNMHNSIHMKKH